MLYEVITQSGFGIQTGGHPGQNLVRTFSPEQLALGTPVRISETDTHEKAVKLGFGQGIGSRLFQRILGGDDEKGIFQRPGLAFNRNLTLFHCFQKCALGFGRGAVDLVSQQHLREDRAGMKHKNILFAVKYA